MVTEKSKSGVLKVQNPRWLFSGGTKNAGARKTQQEKSTQKRNPFDVEKIKNCCLEGTDISAVVFAMKRK